MRLEVQDPRNDIIKATLRSRSLQIHGAIDHDVLSNLHASLTYLKNRSQTAPVEITLFTSGGDLDSALAIHDLIRYYHRKLPIIITACGRCMSAGIIVLLGAHRRMSMPNARFMVHEATVTLSGSISQNDQNAQEGKRIQAAVNDLISKHTKIDLLGLRKKMGSGLDHFYSAKEALEVGLVHGIVGEKTR